MNITDKDVLLVIDMQRDFLPGGSLAVPRGDEVIPVINRLASAFRNVVLTQDWHPAGHISFASRHGLRPFADIADAAYGPQSLWPDHTVQGTPGAELHPDLHVQHASLILRKGFRRDVDSYSAFVENDHHTPTGLHGYLQERGLSRLFLCGVAWDYCVGFSAMDARHLGYDTYVVEDAVRGIAPESMNRMAEGWQQAGVRRIASSALAQGQVTL